MILRLSAAPAGAVRPAHRRVARALMREAGLPCGARLANGHDGDPILFGAPAGVATRLVATLEGLFAPAIGAGLAEVVSVPDGGVPAGPGGPVQAEPGPGPADLERLDDAIAALPLAQIVRRQAVLLLGHGQTPRLAGLRLAVDHAALAAAAPGGLAVAGDADLAGHAADGVRWRLLQALAVPAWRREMLGINDDMSCPVPVLFDLPAGALRGGSPDGPLPEGAAAAALGAPPWIAVVPLAAAAASAPERGGLATLREAVRGAAGCGLALDGLTADALGLLSPDALASADWLILRWSPRLADGRAAAAALRRIDPSRLVLDGCDGMEALEWGLGLGIARFAGPQVEAVLAALRRHACPAGARCTLGECAARAGAIDRAGRAGCDAPDLIGRALPPGDDAA